MSFDFISGKAGEENMYIGDLDASFMVLGSSSKLPVEITIIYRCQS